MSAAQIKQFAKYQQEKGCPVVSRAGELRRQAAMKMERARKLLAEALALEEEAEKEESD